jgi:hypothetical protein
LHTTSLTPIGKLVPDAGLHVVASGGVPSVATGGGYETTIDGPGATTI